MLTAFGVISCGPLYQRLSLGQLKMAFTISPISWDLVILSTRVIMACRVERPLRKPY